MEANKDAEYFINNADHSGLNFDDWIWEIEKINPTFSRGK